MAEQRERKKDVSNMKSVPFGKGNNIGSKGEEEEEKKLTKGLAFVRRETTTTIRKMKRRR